MYDFDKTIYDGDSTADFYLYALGKHKKNLLLAPSLAAAAVETLETLLLKQKKPLPTLASVASSPTLARPSRRLRNEEEQEGLVMDHDADLRSVSGLADCQ